MLFLEFIIANPLSFLLYLLIFNIIVEYNKLRHKIFRNNKVAFRVFCSAFLYIVKADESRSVPMTLIVCLSNTSILPSKIFKKHDF